MPGSQLGRTQGKSRIKQNAKLDGPVAVGAGIGRAALGIGGGKGREYFALKLCAQIDHMQWYIQLGAGLCQARRSIIGPVGQKKTVQGQHVKACRAQHDQGAKAVHAAAHGHGYSG